MGLLKASNLQSVFSEDDDLDFALDDVVMIVMVLYMRAPCRNGHALYNVVEKWR